MRLPLVPQGSGTLGLGSYEFPFAIGEAADAGAARRRPPGAPHRCLHLFTLETTAKHRCRRCTSSHACAALPRDLPGTLKSEYMDARAYIEYKVSAVVDQVGG